MAHPQLPDASSPAETQEEVDNDQLTQALARVEGRVKVSSTRKVTELIDRNPEQTLTVLRNWMHSGGITD